MKKGLLQGILLWGLACLCLGGYLLGEHLLRMPFRTTNDALHRDGAPVTLDFLIPGGVYVDEKATIGDVFKMKLKKTGGPFQKALRSLSHQVPPRYRYLGDALLFFFWTLCYLTFLRVFTFMGYGRALRISLLLGGVTYYFMPDFSVGLSDDILFVVCPLMIIFLRFYTVRRKRKPRRSEAV